MPVYVCPGAVVAAPCAKVWEVLKNTPFDPGWMGVDVERAEPPGVLRPRQTLLLGGSALGRHLQATLETEILDEEQGFVDMLVRLPLGITNHEHMTLAPVAGGACRVQFG
jgi:hypothetical protein